MTIGGSLNTGTGTASSEATFSPPLAVQRSPWHSPVPYLFGGLAVMLGLIAFALLILACSYWRFFVRLEINSRRRANDVEAGDGDYGEPTKALPVFEEKILVIMAGEVKPTFLATPLTSSSSGASSLADHSKDQRCTTEIKEGEGKAELTDKPKQHMDGNSDHDQIAAAAAAAAEGRESERMGGDGDDDDDDQAIVTTTTEESRESRYMGGDHDDQATIITTTTTTTTTDSRESENTVGDGDDNGRTTQTAAVAVAVVNNRKESLRGERKPRGQRPKRVSSY